VFGCGDSEGYGDNFCDAIEEIYSTFKAAGAKMVGSVDASGYSHSESKSDQGVTLLHEACAPECDLEVVKFLISNGADLHAKDDNEETPLHVACHEGFLELAKLLIELGANPNVKGDDENTPLHVACGQGHLEVAIFMIESGGVDLHARNSFGETPLHRTWDYPLAKLLIENGADHNSEDDDGNIPLQMACYSGSLEVAKLLIENGADTNAKDKFGETSLHHACEEGHRDVMQLLLSRGANVGAKTANGSTPLHRACEENHPEIVWFLVRHYPRLLVE